MSYSFYDLLTNYDFMYAYEDDTCEAQVPLRLIKDMDERGFDFNKVNWIEKAYLPSWLFDEETEKKDLGMKFEIVYIIKISDNGCVFLATEKTPLFDIKECKHL